MPSAIAVVSHEHENGEGGVVSVQAVLHVLPAVSLYSKRIEPMPEPPSAPVPLSVTDPRSGLPGLVSAAAVGIVLSTRRAAIVAELVESPAPSVATARSS